MWWISHCFDCLLVEKCQSGGACCHSNRQTISLYYTSFCDMRDNCWKDIAWISRAHFSLIYSFPEKKLLVQKQAFLSSSAMLEFMLSGNINLLVVSMPKLLSFYQDVSTYGAKTTEVPFRAGNPIISTGLRPFNGRHCFAIWSMLNPILELLHFKWIVLFQAFCRQLKKIQDFKRTLTFDRNYTDLHMTS